PFVRLRLAGFDRKAAVVEYDGVLCASVSGAPAALEPDDIVLAPGARELMESYRQTGFRLLGMAWRPQIAEGKTTNAAVLACFEANKIIAGKELGLGFRPPPAGPASLLVPQAAAGTHPAVRISLSIGVGPMPAHRPLHRRPHARCPHRNALYRRTDRVSGL